MVLLFASCGHLSFLLFCFEFCFLCFFVPLKKRPPKKPDTAKTPKGKNAEKKRTKKNQLAQLPVFTDSVLKCFGVGLKFSFFG